MLHLVRVDRAYGPEIIAVMTAAFDRVCETQSSRMSGNDGIKQTLPLIILRDVDRGEHDPDWLFNISVHELVDADCAANG
jgi:hypothetical protein